MITALSRQSIVAAIALAGFIGILGTYLNQALVKGMTAFSRTLEQKPALFISGVCAPEAGQAATNPRPALFIGCGIIE